MINEMHPFKGKPTSFRRHSSWSIYEERSAQLGDGYARWVECPDMAYVIDLQAGPSSRGRELLDWLSVATGKSLYAVGVVEDAEGFWDKMEELGLIEGQTGEGFMAYFGRSIGSRESARRPGPSR